MSDPLDDLLAEANEALTPVPAGLAHRIERRIRVNRQRRFATGVAAVAAAVAIAWFVGRAPRTDERPPPLAAVPPAPATPDLPPAAAVRVTFPADAGVVAVPVPTPLPNVTIIWLFPDRRPAAADDPSPSERNDS